MNPYASTGSVATVTASVSGNDNLNDLGGPKRNVPPMPAGKVTRRLLSYVRPHMASFIISFVSAAISVTLQLYTPILIGQGIDCIVGAGKVDFAALAPIIVKLAIVVVLAAVFQWIQGYCVNRLSYETVRDMRMEASDKLSRMPLSFIDSHAHGDLISRVVNDVDQVGDGLLQGFTQLFTGVVTIVGTLVFMLSISVPMAVVHFCGGTHRQTLQQELCSPAEHSGAAWRTYRGVCGRAKAGGRVCLWLACKTAL